MKNIVNFLTLIFLCFSISMSAQQNTNNYDVQYITNSFDKAAQKYNVPVDLLKSISYSETRFSNIIEKPEDRGPNQQPAVYGIMGLRNDDWFGHSLTEGAKIIGASPERVAINEELNIEAAAALLSAIADSLNIDRSNLNNWRPVLEKFSGIPQTDVKPFYSYGVFDAMSKGEKLKGIAIAQHNDITMSQFPDYVSPKVKKQKVRSVQSADYPPAVWEPSPNYYSDSNFHQLFLVVHDTEGPFAGSLSWLRNPNANASAHYIIRSSDGYVVQMVREKYAAWHVNCWNRLMLGVEHEGYVNNPSYFTEAMYKSSSALYRHLAKTYNIPVNRDRIIGHDEHNNQTWVNWVENTWNKQHSNYAFDPTCNSHTDPGPYWNWNHFLNLINTGATRPAVSSFSLSNQKDSVWANQSFSITFDNSMTQSVTENAVKITPSIDGSFSWSNDGHEMTFTPNGFYQHATTYTVTIDTNAFSILNARLDSVYSFSFTTKGSIPLTVANSYPAQNQNDISTTVKVIVNFNTPLVMSSLGGHILFTDSLGKNVAIKNAAYKEEGGKGILTFEPAQSLMEDALYKLTLDSKVQNINGETLGNDYVLNFKTGNTNFVQGIEFDNFESIGGWKNPAYSGSTNGVDTSKSKFEIIFGHNIDGRFSGRLTSVFSDSTGGLCRYYDAAKPNIGNADSNNIFGIWVNGDLSYNYIEFWFYKNSNENVEVKTDTLNWTGWKFLQIPVGNISSSGDVLFNSIVIKQNPNGLDSSQVYVDEAQSTHSITTGLFESNSVKPSQFKLSQNYPNPFNPSTIIEYQIPKNEFVSLKIYDMLGRNVATLVNEQKAAGNYLVQFNTDELPNKLTSGVYFYTLRTGSFVKTKKLILMK